MMQIGAQFFTLREQCKTLGDFSEALKRVAEIGYRTVQISGVCPYEPEWLRDRLRENGLSCVITHTNQDRIADETEKVIAEHSVFGCDYIGVGSMPGQLRHPGDYESFVERFRPAGAAIAAAGKRLMYHNHHFEFMKAADGRLYLEKLAEDFAPEALGFTLDGTAYYDIFASELIDDMEHNEDGAFCNLESLFGEGARARFMLRSVTVPVNFEELLFNMGCAAQSGDPLGALWAMLDVSYLKAPDLSALVIEKKPEARKTRGRGKGRKEPPVSVTQTVTDKAEAGETQDKNAAPSGEGNEDKSGPGMDGGFLTIDVAQ